MTRKKLKNKNLQKENEFHSLTSQNMFDWQKYFFQKVLEIEVKTRNKFPRIIDVDSSKKYFLAAKKFKLEISIDFVSHFDKFSFWNSIFLRFSRTLDANLQMQLRNCSV